MAQRLGDGEQPRFRNWGFSSDQIDWTAVEAQARARAEQKKEEQDHEDPPTPPLSPVSGDIPEQSSQPKRPPPPPQIGLTIQEVLSRINSLEGEKRHVKKKLWQTQGAARGLSAEIDSLTDLYNRTCDDLHATRDRLRKINRALEKLNALLEPERAGEPPHFKKRRT